MCIAHPMIKERNSNCCLNNQNVSPSIKIKMQHYYLFIFLFIFSFRGKWNTRVWFLFNQKTSFNTANKIVSVENVRKLLCKINMGLTYFFLFWLFFACLLALLLLMCVRSFVQQISWTVVILRSVLGLTVSWHHSCVLSTIQTESVCGMRVRGCHFTTKKYFNWIIPYLNHKYV